MNFGNNCENIQAFCSRVVCGYMETDYMGWGKHILRTIKSSKWQRAVAGCYLHIGMVSQQKNRLENRLEGYRFCTRYQSEKYMQYSQVQFISVCTDVNSTVNVFSTSCAIGALAQNLCLYDFLFFCWYTESQQYPISFGPEAVFKISSLVLYKRMKDILYRF